MSCKLFGSTAPPNPHTLSLSLSNLLENCILSRIPIYCAKFKILKLAFSISSYIFLFCPLLHKVNNTSLHSFHRPLRVKCPHKLSSSLHTTFNSFVHSFSLSAHLYFASYAHFHRMFSDTCSSHFISSLLKSSVSHYLLPLLFYVTQLVLYLKGKDLC